MDMNRIRYSDVCLGYYFSIFRASIQCLLRTGPTLLFVRFLSERLKNGLKDRKAIGWRYCIIC